jgi:hypothetical protein
MLKGGLVFALGLIGVCFPIAAQQTKHSGAAHHHRIAVSTLAPLNAVSGLKLYSPRILSTSNSSLLLQNGPVRAWSDGAQLMNQSAFVQIGMAPLGLFPVTYLAPTDAGPQSASKPSMVTDSRSPNFEANGKDLSGEMFSSPLNRVYCTGEVGFMYGQWSGKGSGDYVGSYVWGQAGNDKFQITAGAAFDDWNGNGRSVRVRSFTAPR